MSNWKMLVIWTALWLVLVLGLSFLSTSCAHRTCITDMECHALDHSRGITDHSGTYWDHPQGKGGF